MPVKDDTDKLLNEERVIMPSSLETIDYAITDWLKEEMQLFSTTHEGWKPVPVVWVSAERSFQIKNNKELRDADGTLKLPLITVERTSVAKDLTRKGIFYGGTGNHVDPQRGGRFVVSRRIKQDKTNNFAIADSRRRLGLGLDGTGTGTGQINFPKKNKKIVYETLSMPQPVYISVNYSIVLRTEYQQQINEILAPFVTLGGHINSFNIKRDGHKYETFIKSDFSLENNTNSIGEEERQYKTTVNAEVLGYLIGEGPNGERPKIIRRESAVEFKFPREHVIVGDIPQWPSSGSGDKRGFYRE